MTTRRGFLRALGLGTAGAGLGCSASRATPSGAMRLAYGDDPAQFGELTLPDGSGPAPVAVVIHGGFWSDRYGVELAAPLAADLAAHGFAALALEYRRLGNGGGWTSTFDDVAAGIDRLRTAPSSITGDRLDLSRVVAIGHSAGGQLAAWAAARPHLADGTPGAAPKVALTGVVSQAGVLDLEAGSLAGLGGGAVDAFLGGAPDTVPDRYAAASPLNLLPLGIPVRLIHGDADAMVPLQQSETYHAAARAVGDDVVLTTLPGVGHFELIDPGDPAWVACRDAMLGLVDR